MLKFNRTYKDDCERLMDEMIISGMKFDLILIRFVNTNSSSESESELLPKSLFRL